MLHELGHALVNLRIVDQDLADIGLEGKKIKKDGKMVDAFYFCVGGSIGKYARPGRPVGFRAAAEDCPEAIERLLRAYLAARNPGEDLRAYFARTDDESLRAQLAGTFLPAVDRDPRPAARRRSVRTDQPARRQCGHILNRKRMAVPTPLRSSKPTRGERNDLHRCSRRVEPRQSV